MGLRKLSSGKSSIFWILGILGLPSLVSASEILWTQYCQHLGKMKLLVHLDCDPAESITEAKTGKTLAKRESERSMAHGRPLVPSTL